VAGGCARGDLNSDVRRHWNLNPARLPVPPRARGTRGHREVSLACGQRYRGGVSDTRGHRTAGSDPASGDPASPVKHRPSWIVFVVLGAIFCLGMGAWQLARYQEASGTVQNLGYTFMWPFLAGFLVYAYLKYVRLEAEEADRVSDAAHGPAAEGVGVDGGVPAGAADEGDDDDNAHPAPHTPAAGSPARPSGHGR